MSEGSRALAELLVQLHGRGQPVPTPQSSSSPWHLQLLPAVGLLLVLAAVALVWSRSERGWWSRRGRATPPKLTFVPTDFNDAVLARCPALTAPYTSRWGWTGLSGHVETIACSFLRCSPPGIEFRREIKLLQPSERAASRGAQPGCVAIDWLHEGTGSSGRLPSDAPVLILFPGLTSGSNNPYVQHMVMSAHRAGMRPAVFNMRGTADSPVLTPQFYSASCTDDARQVVAHIAVCYPGCSLLALGWSLGANILVHLLAEEGRATPLEAAVSLCNPFDLPLANERLAQGFSRLYNVKLTQGMKAIVRKHAPVWRAWHGPDGAALPDKLRRASSIHDFDQLITVHSFGWPSVAAYHQSSSCAPRVPAVAIPLLCIQAADDPIAPADGIPVTAFTANPLALLAVTPTGGHLGWCAPPGSLWGATWADAAATQWLLAVRAELAAAEPLRQLARAQAAVEAAAPAGGASSPVPRLHTPSPSWLRQRSRPPAAEAGSMRGSDGDPRSDSSGLSGSAAASSSSPRSASSSSRSSSQLAGTPQWRRPADLDTIALANTQALRLAGGI